MTTTGILAEYRLNNEPLPAIGDLEALINSEGVAVAVLPTTEIRTCKLKDVDLQHALDEGEDDETVDGWRVKHERFWHSEQFREDMQNSSFNVDNDTVVVLQRFRVVKDFVGRRDGGEVKS